MCCDVSVVLPKQKKQNKIYLPKWFKINLKNKQKKQTKTTPNPIESLINNNITDND